jgi:hypothetical protein
MRTDDNEKQQAHVKLPIVYASDHVVEQHERAKK